MLEDEYLQAMLYSPPPIDSETAHIEEDRVLFAEYQVFLSELRRKSDFNLSPLLTFPLNDSAFNSLLKFCKEVYNDRSVAEELYANSKLLIGNEEKIKNFCRYHELFISILNEIKKSPELLKYIVGGGVCYAAGAEALRALESERLQIWIEGLLGEHINRRRFLAGLFGATGFVAGQAIPDLVVEKYKQVKQSFEDPALLNARKVIVRNTNALIGRFETI